MINLLIDTERLRDLNSGLGQYCLNLGKALVAQQPADVQLTFLMPPGQTRVFGKEVNYREVAWWQRVWGVKAFDVWHSTHQDSAYLPSANTPLVLTIHDLNFLDRPDYSDAKKKQKLAILQRNINRAAAVTTISNYTASVVKQHLQLPNDKPLKVIYNGVPPLVTGQPPSQVVEQAIGQSTFFLSLGVIHPKKNVHVLLSLLQAFPDYKLVMAGDDSHPYAQHIREQAQKLDVSAQLIMPGAVDESTKAWLYEHCEAFLFPSLTEGFGLPVVEAMSIGKPVFLSTLTSLPEIGGKEAVYFNTFEPDDMVETFRVGMQAYYDDPLKANRLRWQANKFSWEKAAKAYWQVYQEVLV